MFQQDEAPFYTSRVTQAHLEKATLKLIKWDKWPPQSPDCNPMDYPIWDSLNEKVYRGGQNKLTKQEIMNRTIISREEISIEKIRQSISAWKKRLRLVVEEDGGHNEHRLK